MRVVIAHGHIFKNAGTSLDWALERNFDSAFIDHRDDIPMRRGGAEYLQDFLEQFPEVKAISSHHLCSVTTIAGIKVLPINLLRDPIERVLSVYKFERRQEAETPGAIAAKKYSFKDYVKWRLEPEVPKTIRNYQTIYLAGAHTLGVREEAGESHFFTAAKRLRTSKCIGIVEKYDESMVVFEDELSRDYPNIDLSYVKQNVSKVEESVLSKSDFVAEELGEVYDDLLSCNYYDLALYALAIRKLTDSINSLPGFARRLKEFSARCASLAS